jgi:hypothetical protein
MKAKQTGDANLPLVVGKTYDFVLWLLPKVEKFSRAYKFTLGERLTKAGLDLLGLVTEAAYSTKKLELLGRANGVVNQSRFLLRLAKDLTVLHFDGYAHGVEMLDEIGRMIGGWTREQAGRAVNA